MGLKELLISAIEQGNEAEVCAIVSNNLIVLELALDEQGYTAIHVAAAHGYASILQWLLQQKPELKDQATPLGYTPLMLAAHHYVCPLAQDARLNLKAPPNLVNLIDSFLAQPKSKSDHSAVILFLITSHANIKIKINAPGHPYHGYSVTDFARGPTIRLLLVESLAPNNYDGKQWLTQAMDGNDSKLRDELIKKDPSLATFEAEYWVEKAFKTMKLSVDSGYLPIDQNMSDAHKLQILTAYKIQCPSIKPNVQYRLRMSESSAFYSGDDYAYPKACYSYSSDDDDYFCWLMKNGIDICFSGDTALLPGLIYSIIITKSYNKTTENNKLDTIKHCIKNYRHEMNQPLFESTDTLLMRLTRQSKIPYIQMLIELGVDVDIVTTKGRKAIHYAKELDVFKLFNYQSYLDSAKDYTGILHPIFTINSETVLAFMLNALPSLVNLRNNGETLLLRLMLQASSNINQINILLNYNANPLDFVNDPSHANYGLNAIQLLQCYRLRLLNDRHVDVSQIKIITKLQRDLLQQVDKAKKLTAANPTVLDANNLTVKSSNSNSARNPDRLFHHKKQLENNGAQPAKTKDKSAYDLSWDW